MITGWPQQHPAPFPSGQTDMLCLRCRRPPVPGRVRGAPGGRSPHLRLHPEGAGPQARAPHRPHRHLGPAGVPRHRVHTPHLRLLGVLRGHGGQHGGLRRVPAHHDGELHLPGVRQVRHRPQARLSPRSEVSTSLKCQRAEKTLLVNLVAPKLEYKITLIFYT